MDAAAVFELVLVVALLTAWATRRLGGTSTPRGSAIVDPGAPQAVGKDHEGRLVKLEYKFHALELEWEDTRAKFLGMTRSFIRHAKAAGLDNGTSAGSDAPLQAEADPGAVAGPLSSRAAVLKAFRRNHAARQ